jgi:hypothetical protein
MTTLVLVRPHGIQHEIGLTLRPKHSRLQQEQHLKFFCLKQIDEKSYITNQQAKKTIGAQIFSFVILKNPQPTHDHFELRISQGGHFPTSGKAMSVAAAGDIYTNETGEIKKITDQSGTFYIPNTDPALAQKKASALRAMKTLGLPIELFKPFSVGNTLTFSSRLRQVRPFLLTPTAHQDTAARPLEDECRHARPGSFLAQQ